MKQSRPRNAGLGSWQHGIDDIYSLESDEYIDMNIVIDNTKNERLAKRIIDNRSERRR